jgi:hypothetical protein
MSKQITFSTEKIKEIADRLDRGFVIPRHEKYWYKNMPFVKKEGLVFDFTEEELMEYTKCKFDVKYFAETYCLLRKEDSSIGNIILRDFQAEILDMFVDNRFNIIMASRQSSKTVTACIFLLHACIFENNRNILIVANLHTTIAEIVFKFKEIYTGLPMFLKPGVNNWAKGSITFSDNNNRLKTLSASATSSASSSVNILYMDEFGLVDNSIQEDFYRTTYPTVSSFENSKIIITSTPRGLNLFHQLLQDAERPVGDKKKNNFNAKRVYWYQVPGRFVTYLKLDENICAKYNIKAEEILNWVNNLGFKANLKYDYLKGNSVVHILNRYEDLPFWFNETYVSKDGDNTVSDYFRECTFERGEEKYRLLEIADISSWKEDAIADIGSEDSFNQEYGLQFLAGNKMIFDAQFMDKIINGKIDFEHLKIPTLDQRTMIDYSGLTFIKDRPNLFSLANIKNYHIVFSIDLGTGIGQDFSVLNIFRLMIKPKDLWPTRPDNFYDFFYMEQIGLYRSNMISVPEITELFYLIAFEIFNPDKVGAVLELNSGGSEMTTKIKDLFLGRNQYSSHVFFRYKHRADAVEKSIGLKVNLNKESLVKSYQKRMKLSDIVVHEENTLHEVSTFIKKESKAGSVQFAAESGHDDIVMSIVNLSTAFENSTFHNLCDSLLSETPYILNEIEERLSNNPNISTADYSSLFSALRGNNSVNRVNKSSKYNIKLGPFNDLASYAKALNNPFNNPSSNQFNGY